MHTEYWQSYFKFGTSSPCCVESFLCKQAILGKQECCNARPLQVCQRHGHSCCLFRCCPQESIQTRSLEDGYCVSPVVAFHCWATWWRGLDVAVARNPSSLERTSEILDKSPWLKIIVCRVFGTILEICSLCFSLAKGAMGCACNELVPRKRSTSWTACLHVGFDESAVLQAQTNWKLARTCPEHFLLDEPIRWFSCLHWHLMNVKCKFNLLCLLWHARLTFTLTQKQTENFRCHRETNCLFWSWVPVRPCCWYGLHFRRMIRCVVGAPGRICWHDPWYDILHIWNQRVREMVEVCHIKMWAETRTSQQWKSVALYHHWKLAGYIANLPPNRWAKRALEWQPRAKRVGRRPNTWVTWG